MAQNRKTVAVDRSLTPVRSLLQQQGYSVVDVDNIQQADCVVVSGGADTMLGIETTRAKAPVINAEGRSAQDILAEVKRYLH